MGISVMTLEIGGEREIENPTDEQIRAELSSLDTEGEDSFALLGPTAMTYLQISGDQTVGFALEYQDGSVDEHYRATADSITLDQAILAFIAYRDGNESWKAGFVFEKMIF